MEAPETREPLSSDVRIKRVESTLKQLTQATNDQRSRRDDRDPSSYEFQALDFARQVLEASLGSEAKCEIPDSATHRSFVLNFEGE